MSDTTYYWQGGHKIEIEHKANLVTVQAESVDVVDDIAARSGVLLRKSKLIASGLVEIEIVDDRDASIKKLRDTHVVHHVYNTKGQCNDDVLITEMFFIKFKAGTHRQDINSYFQTESLVIANVFDELTYLVKVTDATGKNPIKTANQAASYDIVEYAEPNIVRQLSRFNFFPADPLFPSQWHLYAPIDDTELLAGAGIGAPFAWEQSLGSRDIVIAVADDGFDITHPDFQGEEKIAGRLNVIPHPNGVDLAFNDAVQPQSGDYHGTPCAGVALAEHNGIGTVGVAPGCAFYAVRFPLSLSDAQLARMFERISSEADVVSCSWGYGPAFAPMSTTLREMITRLADSGGRRRKGLVICVAAGNNNCPIRDLNNTETYQFLDRFNNLRSYSGPIDRWLAAHPDVITVSAVTSLKQRAAYSSWGQEINVCAPSNNFDDLKRFRPQGRGIWTTDNENLGEHSDFTPGSRYTGEFGGTSSATPTVAGVCGLILSRNNSLKAEQVRKIVEQTASKDLVVESETTVNISGNFDSNGFSPWFGYGKLDAASAVAQARVLANEQIRIDVEANDLPIEILDNSKPINSQIHIDNIGIIADLRIRVQITHTYIGDLRIELVSPDGSVITLQNHLGGSRQNLDHTYSLDEVIALRVLQGKSVSGTWILRVVDTWFIDHGRLESWRLIAKVI